MLGPRPSAWSTVASRIEPGAAAGTSSISPRIASTSVVNAAQLQGSSPRSSRSSMSVWSSSASQSGVERRVFPGIHAQLTGHPAQLGRLVRPGSGPIKGVQQLEQTLGDGSCRLHASLFGRGLARHHEGPVEAVEQLLRATEDSGGLDGRGRGSQA